jgi:tRNA(fMet)-specific endonuclease VapC
MICLESSFLIDWFRGQDYTHEFFESRDGDEHVLVPTPVLHELLRGALRTDSYPTRPADIYAELDYAEFRPLTVGAAETAAEIRVTLTDRGERIGAFDTLIAGTARDAGATLVTTDEHYQRVDDLDVRNPRHEN